MVVGTRDGIKSGWMELVQFDTGMIPARHDTLAYLSRWRLWACCLAVRKSHSVSLPLIILGKGCEAALP